MIAILKINNSSLTTRVNFEDIKIIRPYLSTLWLNDGYVYLAKDSSVKLHRFLLNGPKGLYVDHINREKLDNTRDNLRLATPSENSMNRSPRNKYKGVSWRKDKGRWQASARDPKTKKNKHLGYYAIEKDAAQAYNEYIIMVHVPEFAYLNDIEKV